MKKINECLVVGAGFVGRATALQILTALPDMKVAFSDTDFYKGDEAVTALSDYKGRLTYGSDEIMARYHWKAVFVCVPTNPGPNGDLDCSAVFSVLDQYQADFYIVKSTLSFAAAKQLSARVGAPVLTAPEFLREVNWREDCLNMDRSLVGIPNVDIPIAASIIEAAKFYDSIVRPLMKDSSHFASPNPVSSTLTYAEAAIAKLAANAFLATRLTQFNVVAEFCAANGLHVESVLDGMRQDPRIGHGHSRPGHGYGGSCFPKDVRSLGALIPFYAEVDATNHRLQQQQICRIQRAVMEARAQQEQDGTTDTTYIKVVIWTPHNEAVKNPNDDLVRWFNLNLDVQCEIKVGKRFDFTVKIQD